MLQVPSTPPEELLVSMALCYRHDFGLHKDSGDKSLTSGVTAEEREHILRLMSKLYAEATGQGFYKMEL